MAKSGYIEKEVPIQIPVENRIIEIVEKEAPIRLIEKIKLDIPKYAYIGSTETCKFHKRECRLSKLIKRNHKLSNNSQAFFKRKHFKACKSCLKKN